MQLTVDIRLILIFFCVWLLVLSWGLMHVLEKIKSVKVVSLICSFFLLYEIKIANIWMTMRLQTRKLRKSDKTLAQKDVK